MNYEEERENFYRGFFWWVKASHVLTDSLKHCIKIESFHKVPWDSQKLDMKNGQVKEGGENHS